MATIHSVDIRVGLVDETETGFDDIERRAGESINRIGSMWSQFFLGRELERFGMIGVHAFGDIVRAAADLETAMGNISIAIGQPLAAIAGLRNAVIDIAQTHTMATADAAQMVAVMGRGGIKDPSQLTQLLNPAQGGGFADFADIMKVSRGIDVQQTAQLGVEFTSLLGGASVKETLRGLEELNKAVSFSPQSDPRAILQTFKNIHGIAGMAGIGVEPQLQVSALLNEIGLQGRGGTELASGLMHLLTSKAGAQFIDRDRNGNVDLFGTLQRIQTFEKEHPHTAIAEEKKAFGMIGVRALGVLAQPEHLAQIQRLMDEWGKLPSIAATHAQLMGQTNAQLAVLTTNFQGLLAAIGTGTLTSVNKALTTFSDALASATLFLNAHPRVQSAVGTAALTGAGGSAGLIGAGGLATYGAIGGAFGMPGAALAASAAPAAAMAAPVVGLGVLAGKTGHATELLTSGNPLAEIAGAIGVLVTIIERQRAPAGQPLATAADTATNPAEAGGSVHVHGDVHVHANTPHDFATQLAHHARLSTGMGNPGSGLNHPAMGVGGRNF